MPGIIAIHYTQRRYYMSLNTLWAARSAEFFERDPVVFLGIFRALPDTIIIVLGVLPLAYFLITTSPHLKAAEIKDGESVWERLGIEL